MRLSRRGRHGGDPVGGPTVVTPVLSTEEASLAAEVLKVLYNLTCSLDKFHVEEEDEVHFERLVGLLHDLLLCDVADVETKDQLHGQVVHLLSSVPRSSYAELLTEASSGEEGSFEGYNIDAVAVLVAYLERRLDEVEAKPSFQRQLTPVLLCLAECGHGHRILRRYLRSRVWDEHQEILLTELSDTSLQLCGYGQYDSPGHSAKFLLYSFLYPEKRKIIHTEQVQVKESEQVQACAQIEKEGLIRGLKFLFEQGMTVSSLTTDRHSGIKRHMRLQCPEINHHFDVWHVAKDYVQDLHKKVMELCAQYETFSKALAQAEESVPAAFSSRDDQRVPKRDLVAAHKARFLKF